MTTRAGLRALARGELSDLGAAQVWTDGLLDRWAVEALRAYGRDVPREASATLTSVTAQADYALPADCRRVVRVEHPSGCFRVADPAGGGDCVAVQSPTPTVQGEGGQLAYEVWGAPGGLTLSLRPAPVVSGEGIGVRYLAAYAEPAADGDVLATPTADDHLLVWLVAERALQWLATDESKRQRFERQRGVSTAEAARAYRERYRGELERRGRGVAGRRLVRGSETYKE
jgi:hypothetical protein